MATRTNFYKIPIDELEGRVCKLREWWWDNRHDPRRNEVCSVLRTAYEALQNRRNKNKAVQQAIEIFWDDVPEKYDEKILQGLAESIDPELAKETGLKKISGGWVFDSQKYSDLKSPSGLI